MTHEFFYQSDRQSDHGLYVAINFLYKIVIFVLAGVRAGLVQVLSADFSRLIRVFGVHSGGSEHPGEVSTWGIEYLEG